MANLGSADLGGVTTDLNGNQVSAQLPALSRSGYAGFPEALIDFNAKHLRRGLCNAEIHKGFANELARIVGVEAGELEPPDYELTRPEFNNQSLRWLLSEYRPAGGKSVDALSALNAALEIKDLRKEPYPDFETALSALRKGRDIWARTTIAQRYESLKLLAPKSPGHKIGKIRGPDFKIVIEEVDGRKITLEGLIKQCKKEYGLLAEPALKKLKADIKDYLMEEGLTHDELADPGRASKKLSAEDLLPLIRSAVNCLSRRPTLKRIARLVRAEPGAHGVSNAQVKAAIRSSPELKKLIRGRSPRPVAEVDLVEDADFSPEGPRELRAPARKIVQLPESIEAWEKLCAQAKDPEKRAEVFGSPQVYLATILLDPDFFDWHSFQKDAHRDDLSQEEIRRHLAEFRGLLDRPLGVTDENGQISITLPGGLTYAWTPIRLPQAGWEISIAQIGMYDGQICFRTTATRGTKRTLPSLFTCGTYARELARGGSAEPIEVCSIISLDAMERISGRPTFRTGAIGDLSTLLVKSSRKILPRQQLLESCLLGGDFEQTLLGQGFNKQEIKAAYSRLQGLLAKADVYEEGEFHKLSPNYIEQQIRGFQLFDDRTNVLKLLFSQVQIDPEKLPNAARLKRMLNQEQHAEERDIRQIIQVLAEAYVCEFPPRLGLDRITVLVNWALTPPPKESGKAGAETGEGLCEFPIEIPIDLNVCDRVARLAESYPDASMLVITPSGEQIELIDPNSIVAAGLKEGVKAQIWLFGSAASCQSLRQLLPSAFAAPREEAPAKTKLVWVPETGVLEIARKLRSAEFCLKHSDRSKPGRERVRTAQEILIRGEQLIAKLPPEKAEAGKQFEKLLWAHYSVLCKKQIVHKYLDEARKTLAQVLVPRLGCFNAEPNLKKNACKVVRNLYRELLKSAEGSADIPYIMLAEAEFSKEYQTELEAIAAAEKKHAGEKKEQETPPESAAAAS